MGGVLPPSGQAPHSPRKERTLTGIQERQRPDLLDPDRVLTRDRDDMTADDHRNRAQLLDDALHKTCAYANQLWDQLDAARRYLAAALPAPPAQARGAIGPASPHGRDDRYGWQAWEDIYTDITAVLAGPHGDQGFARDEAREFVRARLDFSRDQQPTPETLVQPTEEESER
jgi:hypothetical protein